MDCAAQAVANDSGPWIPIVEFVEGTGEGKKSCVVYVTCDLGEEDGWLGNAEVCV